MTGKIISEKKLKEMLEGAATPNIREEAKEKALEAALNNFDTVQEQLKKAKEKQNIAHLVTKSKKNKKNEKKFQGNFNNERQKVMEDKNSSKNKPLTIWRRIMEKQSKIGPISGAVAACALLIFAGGPFILDSYKPQTTEVFVDTRENNSQIEKNTKPKDVANSTAPKHEDIKLTSKDNINKGKTTPSNNAASATVTTATATTATVKVKEVRDKISTIKPIEYGLKQQNKIEVTRNIAKKNAMEGMIADEMISASPNIESKVKAIKLAPSMPMGRAGSAPLVEKTHYTASRAKIASDVIIDNSFKAVGRDKFKDFEDSPIKLVTKEPVSTFSIDVDTASYTFARNMINMGRLPQKDAVRVEEFINYFDYNYPVPSNKTEPFKPTVAVYDSPWKAGNKLIHIGIKAYDIDTAEKPKSNLVFLIDTSGSMNAPNKLPLLINSMKMLVNNLQPNDSVAIVTYAGNAGVVLEPTKVSDKYKIISALERLRSGGSTAGAAGIKTAYNLIEQNFDKQAVNRVILATDGDFNVGITNPEELQDFIERKRKTGVFLSVLGFGEGNYNDALMQRLAQKGNGNAAYIDTLNEARKVLVDEASSTLFTVAKDVKIQVEFNPKKVAEYRLIGYETRKLNREDFNNDKVDAGEIGAGHSVTAIYEITPVEAKNNRLIDDLRYGADKKSSTNIKEDKGEEYAFLKIRYKLPKEDKSKLITRPITKSDEISFNSASDDIRFAVAVAAFAQKLRGGKYIGNMSYDDIINIAKNAKGKDEFGYRAEFVNLVRLAKIAFAMPK